MSERILTLAQAVGEAGAHRQAGRIADAKQIYETILGEYPAHRESLYALSDIAAAEGELSRAIELTARLTDGAPRDAIAYANLGALLRASGQIEEAGKAYRAAFLLDPAVWIDRVLLNLLLYQPGLSVERLFAEHVAFGQRHAPAFAEILPPPPNNRDPERRLRVGLISADFGLSALGRNIRALFSHRDRSASELVCYAEVSEPDAYTAFFQRDADGWRSTIDMSDRAVAEMIRSDAIDVLIVLSGHFDANRPLIASYRPAPVQVSMLDGATSGLPGMDYWIGDPVMTPPGSAELFTERIVHIPLLPDYPPIEGAPSVGSLPAVGNGFVTFGCFARPSKISGAAIELWASAMRTIPSARLAFKFKNRFTDQTLRARLRVAFAALGIEPDRIIFLPDDSRLPYLDAYNAVDIVLDTQPFPGVTTTFDALWMGVPTLTLTGSTALSRMSASVLDAVGLRSFITHSAEQFVGQAAHVAADVSVLADLRRSLRQRTQTSPLCDGPSWARSVEQLWRSLWRDWCVRPDPDQATR